MALSNFLIRPPAEAQQGQSAPRRRQPTAQAGNAPDFAAIMSGQAARTESAPAAGPVANFAEAGGAQRSFVLAGRSPGDLLRSQTFNKAQTDLRQTQAMEGLMGSMSGSGSTLDLARSMGTARHLRSLTNAMGNRFPGLSLGDFVHSRGTAKNPGPGPGSPKKSVQSCHDTELGMLSARFESGSDGIAAVGYDRNGGTSYGKYQVSSRAGSLQDFLDFMDTEAPDLSRRLRASGPGNTGCRQGAMPDTWRAIAREQPERFEELQEVFVRKSHYMPAVEAITQRTGLEADTLSPAMREVIWSTAVQHGPAGAARIFARAHGMSGKPDDPSYERNLISHVYQIRVGQFGSSTSSVQAAVANRFKQEKVLALNMLDGGKNSSLA